MVAAPNILKENLLQQGFAHAAMTLDALFTSDCIQWDTYDFAAIMGQIAIAGISMGESLVRRGLRDLNRLGLLASRRIMTRTKGRPAYEYRLATVSGMANILGVKIHRDEHADEIKNEEFSSTKSYRRGLHIAYIAKRPGRYSRKWLGHRLGVSKRSTFNYELASGIEVQQMNEREELDEFSLKYLPKMRVSGRYFLMVESDRPMTSEEKEKAYPHVPASEREFWNRTTTDTKYLPLISHLAKRELAKGHRIYRAWQSTNYYKIN